jgi:hypothetical protein
VKLGPTKSLQDAKQITDTIVNYIDPEWLIIFGHGRTMSLFLFPDQTFANGLHTDQDRSRGTSVTPVHVSVIVSVERVR